MGSGLQDGRRQRHLKHNIVFKFLSVFLCAAALLAAVGSCVGIVMLTGMNLYEQNYEDWVAQEKSDILQNYAVQMSRIYASRELGQCPQTLADSHLSIYEINTPWNQDALRYAIYDEDGRLLESTLEEEKLTKLTDPQSFQILWGRYIKLWYSTPMAEANQEGGTSDALLPSYVDRSGYWVNYYDSSRQEQMYGYVTEEQLPAYTVSVYAQEDAFRDQTAWDLQLLLYQLRNQLFVILGVSLLIIALTAVYLCCSAGRKPGTDRIEPTGLNNMPLDLYAAAAALGIYFLVALMAMSTSWILDHAPQVCLAMWGFGGFAVSLLFVGFWFAFAAQAKMKKGYWWRHSAIGWILRQALRFCEWVCRSLVRMVEMLPFVWQFVAVFGCLGFFMLISIFSGSEEFFIFLVLVTLAAAAYAIYSYGTLQKGVQRMAQGDLNQKINTRYLIGTFRDCANHLNALAGVAAVAAEKHLRSERMKTELITNVSHDIKTPLTSIINYVDLLKKPHAPEAGPVYLDVLDRQSQRLKKLIDDLMEMSKASTGNLQVNTQRLNAAEAVNQALGEFADKMEGANLIPVFRCPETPVTMLADGKLVWRIFSNVLNNAVKYALPGTRVYIDLMHLNGNAVISVKNVSREQLNVRADELMERFVRGDASRNTEGSGLGLNIAKSLMELQKGQLHLLVDGDLFKVTLIFPAVNP